MRVTIDGMPSRRLSDGTLRPAEVLAGLGMVGFRGLLAVRTAQES